MRVALRVDASRQIGTGHVIRCLTLAERLRANGSEARFVCRDLESNLMDAIGDRGFPVDRLPAPGAGWAPDQPRFDHEHWLQVPWQRDAEETAAALGRCESRVDWLVVDHYGIDIPWESTLRPHCGRIMVIDDLADRCHDCDLLLDQNYYADLEGRYDGLVPEHCQLHLGPRFTLLREEFFQQRPIERSSGPVREVLVFFGGADLHDLTGRTLSALRALIESELRVTAVLGQTNPHREHLEREFAADSWLTIYAHTGEMARLMAAADLGVGGGGTTTWERCVMGLPTIAVAVADNQSRMLDDLHRYGAVWHLGWHEGVTREALAQAIADACINAEKRVALGRRAAALMGDEHQSGTSAIADALRRHYER